MSDERQTDRVVVAVVLAAGSGERMGTQKLLLPLRGRPLVRWSVEAALASTAKRVVVVLGDRADAVGECLTGLRVDVVTNTAHALGMSTSLRTGVKAAGDCDAAIFLLGDQPFVTGDLLDRLIHEFERTDKAVVRPVAEGRPANPVLMSAALFPEILRQQGDVGGREVVERHPDEVQPVPLDDPRVVMDIDSREDYELAREQA